MLNEGIKTPTGGTILPKGAKIFIVKMVNFQKAWKALDIIAIWVSEVLLKFPVPMVSFHLKATYPPIDLISNRSLKTQNVIWVL